MTQPNRVHSFLIRVGIICALFLINLGPIDSAAAVITTIYVAPAPLGNDNNPGTDTAPYETLAHAITQVVPGTTTTIALNGGVYPVPEAIAWPLGQSGTSSSWISVQPYNNLLPILECGQTTTIESCVRIAANYIEIQGLEIRNSKKSGIAILGGKHIRILNNSIHGSQSQGVYVGHGVEPVNPSTSEDILIDNNTVNDNARRNSLRQLTEQWDSGIGINDTASNIRITNNHVYENYGEGILIAAKSATPSVVNTLVQNNRIHDNYSVNLYLDGANNAVFERNFIYTTGNAAFFHNKYNAPANGISLANESNTLNESLSNNTIRNNIVVGGRFAFYYGSYDQGGGIKNTRIFHNTFYSNMFYPGGSIPIPNGNPIIFEPSATIKIAAGPHLNTLFYNNAVMQTSTAAIRDISSTGIDFQANGWYVSPGTIPNGTGGGVGDILANPQFINPTASIISPENFKLAGPSPLVNVAVATQVPTTNDFWGNARLQGGVNDIGAHEAPTGVMFEQASYTTNESTATGAGKAIITVKRTNAMNQPVTVNYATSNGTASGKDYIAKNGQLNFTATELVKTIEVFLLEDETMEGNETFNVTLSAASGVALGNPAVTTVTIAANDSIAFSASTMFVYETANTVQVEVYLNAPSSDPITVNYARTASGTAKIGSDYNATNGTLQFLPGQTSASFPVQIVNDGANGEPDETIYFTLSAPVNAAIGPSSMVVITIRDGCNPMIC